MILVKRSVFAEQLESYSNQLAAVATVKKQMADCVVIANKAFSAQQALHDNWTELTAKHQRLQEAKAILQEQIASRRKQLSARSSS